jgi:lipoprotein signal peptidase
MAVSPFSPFFYIVAHHTQKNNTGVAFSLFGTEISYAVILTNTVEYGIILAVTKNTSFDIADFNLGKE